MLNTEKSINILSKIMQFIVMCYLKLYSIEQIGENEINSQVRGRRILVLTTSYGIKNAFIGLRWVRVHRASAFYWRLLVSLNLLGKKRIPK